jgi:threonine/homoserine/homoserine lactone efflux protein
MDQIAPYLPQLILAWSIQAMGVISPGPAVVLIMGVAVKHGRGTALITSFGIACASVVLAIATVIGIAALFAQAAWLMTIVRIIGAAYLFYLAYKAFRTAVTLPPIDLTAQSPPNKAHAALAGFAMQLTNPKAIFFWLAVAAAGGVGTAPLPVIVIFVIGAFVNSFVGHGGYALILSSPPIRRGYLRARRYVETALGTVFASAGLKLALER